ncbi:MAG: FtsX-like permease family protein [Candidatus Krumholzibacteria bacterium]|nr:FtsX-like permease family protein [Candidatus Krumholzibacteria bacterium]
MIRFLLKGIVRDRHRSFFPVLIVTLGVAVTTVMHAFMDGMADEMVRNMARLDSGHVKVVTRGYGEIVSQIPNDLAIRSADSVMAALEARYPGMEWTPRIKFGGLLDFPDSTGETRAQGPAAGFAADLLGEGSGEIARLNLAQSLVRGRLPSSPNEILVSDEFASRLGVEIGGTATLIGSTAYGSMAVHNFRLAGTIRFGIAPLDRNMLIADIADVRYALDMEDMTAEILGFFPTTVYDDGAAELLADDFNGERPSGGPAGLRMLTLRGQGGIGQMLDMARSRSAIIIAVFIVIMSIVLWNTGLMSGIRRYGELGVRLALGESHRHVYGTLIAESILIGIGGTAAGAAIGLAVSYFLQEVGWDISGMMRGSSVMMSNVIRARVTPATWMIGLIPGMAATILGAVFSGSGIFRRETSRLFKELEV